MFTEMRAFITIFVTKVLFWLRLFSIHRSVAPFHIQNEQRIAHAVID